MWTRSTPKTDPGVVPGNRTTPQALPRLGAMTHRRIQMSKSNVTRIAGIANVGLESEAMKEYAERLRRQVALVQQASAQLWSVASGQPMESGSVDGYISLLQLQQSLGEIGNIADVLENEADTSAFNGGTPEESGTRRARGIGGRRPLDGQDEPSADDDAGRGTMRSARYAM